MSLGCILNKLVNEYTPISGNSLIQEKLPSRWQLGLRLSPALHEHKATYILRFSLQPLDLKYPISKLLCMCLLSSVRGFMLGCLVIPCHTLREIVIGSTLVLPTPKFQSAASHAQCTVPMLSRISKFRVSVQSSG